MMMIETGILELGTVSKPPPTQCFIEHFRCVWEANLTSTELIFGEKFSSGEYVIGGGFWRARGRGKDVVEKSPLF